jgi:excisionase family DNA binding protein
MDGDFVTMREAAEILGVSKFTMWRLVRDGELVAYRSGSDRREKLVRRTDVEAYKAPKPIAPGAPKKAAA